MAEASRIKEMTEQTQQPDYKLNYMRWLTNGEVPDEMLNNSHDWEAYKGLDGKYHFKFKTKARFDTTGWRGCYASVST